MLACATPQPRAPPASPRSLHPPIATPAAPSAAAVPATAAAHPAASPAARSLLLAEGALTALLFGAVGPAPSPRPWQAPGGRRTAPASGSSPAPVRRGAPGTSPPRPPPGDLACGLRPGRQHERRQARQQQQGTPVKSWIPSPCPPATLSPPASSSARTSPPFSSPASSRLAALLLPRAVIGVGSAAVADEEGNEQRRGVSKQAEEASTQHGRPLVCRLLFLSNGHGEDVIGAGIARELLRLQEEHNEEVRRARKEGNSSSAAVEEGQRVELVVEALPLVGTGGAYVRTGIPVVGPTRNMPSGGFVYMDAKQLLGDVRAGLVELTLQQWRTICDWVDSHVPSCPHSPPVSFTAEAVSAPSAAAPSTAAPATAATGAAEAAGVVEGAAGVVAVGDVLPLAFAFLAAKRAQANASECPCAEDDPTTSSHLEDSDRGMGGTVSDRENSSASSRGGLGFKGYVFVGTAKSEYYIRQEDEEEQLDESSSSTLNCDDCNDLGGGTRGVQERGFLRTVSSLPGRARRALHRAARYLKEEVVWRGGVYHAWEQWLMSRPLCQLVVVRDQLTADVLAHSMGEGGGIDSTAAFLSLPPLSSTSETGAEAAVVSSGSESQRNRTKRRRGPAKFQGQGKVKYWGNQMMDHVSASGHLLPYLRTYKQQHFPPAAVASSSGSNSSKASSMAEDWRHCVVVLPGSRAPEAYRNFELLLQCVDELVTSPLFNTSQVGGSWTSSPMVARDMCQLPWLFLVPVASSALDVGVLSDALDAHGWSQQDLSLPPTSTSATQHLPLSVWVRGESPSAQTKSAVNAAGGHERSAGAGGEQRGVQGVLILVPGALFGDCVSAAEAGLAMAGTATEQLVGLGKPVVSLPGEGPQFTHAFAEAQTRLLGCSVSLCTVPSEAATSLAHALRAPPAERQRVANNGVRRMGGAGASRLTALGIWRSLVVNV